MKVGYWELVARLQNSMMVGGEEEGEGRGFNGGQPRVGVV